MTATSLAHIAALIARTRLPLNSEKATQVALEGLFTSSGITAEREVVLGPKDIVDFLTPDGLAIELKLKGARSQFVRQLTRYATHERVKSLLLVTARSIILPADISGKPVRSVSLCAGWL